MHGLVCVPSHHSRNPSSGSLHPLQFVQIQEHIPASGGTSERLLPKLHAKPRLNVMDYHRKDASTLFRPRLQVGVARNHRRQTIRPHKLRPVTAANRYPVTGGV